MLIFLSLSFVWLFKPEKFQLKTIARAMEVLGWPEVKWEEGSWWSCGVRVRYLTARPSSLTKQHSCDLNTLSHLHWRVRATIWWRTQSFVWHISHVCAGAHHYFQGGCQKTNLSTPRIRQLQPKYWCVITDFCGLCLVVIISEWPPLSSGIECKVTDQLTGLMSVGVTYHNIQ